MAADVLLQKHQAFLFKEHKPGCQIEILGYR